MTKTKLPKLMKPGRAGRRTFLHRPCFAVIILCFIVITEACTTFKDPAFWGALTSELTGSFPTYPELLVFGGRNNDVFLGCLNCSKFDSDSVFNRYGAHGSRYGARSLLNSYSSYGSRFSAYSACNPYASEPPIVVDAQGNSYGHLTLNQFNRQVRYSTIVAWLTGMCAR